MSDVLTDKEASALFNQVSKAVHDSDNDKLSELMDKKPLDTKEEPIVKDPPADKPDEKDDKDKKAADPTTDKSASDAEDKTNDPLAKADVVDKKDEKLKPEPSETDKLKEQLDKVAKENHALRSAAGRVPHVQRRIKELDKKLEEIAKRNASTSSQTSETTQPKVMELLKGISETDPALAEAIAAAIGQASKDVTSEMRAKETETLHLLREQEVQVYKEQEVASLLEMYPNAVQVFADPHWESWKKEQSPGIVSLANSDTASEVAFAFAKYSNDMKTRYPSLTQTVDSKVEPTAVSNDATEKAKQIEAERQRKKETAANIGSASAQGQVAMSDDPEALFKKYSEEIRKERLGK